MEKDITSINCPNCGAEVNVSEILYHQVQEQLKKDFEEQSAQKEKDYQKKLNALKLEKVQLTKDKESVQEQIDNAVKSKLNAEKIKLEKSISEKIKEENSEQIQDLQKELGLKTNQLKDLNKTKAEVERLKREKDELRDQVVLEKEQEYSIKLTEERNKIKKQADENSAMKIKELEKQLEVQINLAAEMKRKAEQGSMQLQGEIQELAIEEILKSLFQFDLISEVGKGVKGADVIHTVRNKTGVDCGIILYESKRTKAFSNEWINKLKTDAVASKADISIIVTEALPEGIDNIGQKDGVWICTFNNFKSLVLVLRESLIKINEAYSSQTNKRRKDANALRLFDK